MDSEMIAAELNRMKLLNYYEDRSIKAEIYCGKVAPRFEMDEGILWTDFMTAFKSSVAGVDDLLQEHLKRLLYIHLKPKAQRLVGTGNIPQEHEEKTFEEYHTMLGNIFEPLQLQGEHPQIYFTDKRNLFERVNIKKSENS